MSHSISDTYTIHNIKLDDHFTTIHNSNWEIPGLSWDAKGLLTYILTRPKNWKIYSDQLASIYQGKKKGNGKDAILSMLNELKEFEFIIHTKSKDSKGKWIHRYDVYPMPIRDFQKMFPERDYPGLDHPATDNPVILTRKDKVLSSTESFKNKKEQQQTNVVFYDSLNDDRLSQDDKQSLMRYPEERVQKAFEFAKSTKIKTTLVQVLVWHCTQVNPPLPGKKNTLKLECQKAAIGLKSENCEFHVSDEGVTFVALVGQMQPITIKYTDEDAKNKILQKLKHFKFKEIKN